jgi:uncharacterized membrane protein
MNRLLSPNIWVGIFSMLAIVGIVLAAVGAFADLLWAKTAGWVLISPIILAGVLLVVVGFPVLILANRKHVRSNKDDYDGQGNNAKNT